MGSDVVVGFLVVPLVVCSVVLSIGVFVVVCSSSDIENKISGTWFLIYFFPLRE